MNDEARKRREEARKERELVNGIIDFLTPTIKNMKMWEIESLIGKVLRTIEFKFHPFRTFEQAIEYRKGK
jgi:hypothetical protein